MNEKDFNYHEWSFPTDYEGDVSVCFIESAVNTRTRPAILYLHGFMDYFFQFHVAEYFHQNGYDFYALDLRKYGRSIRKNQRPCFCKSLEEYFPEISKAIKTVCEKPNTPLILYGHSTGGLIASLYMNKGEFRDKVDALLLNSPYLCQNMGKVKQFTLDFFTRIMSVIHPKFSATGSISSLFPRSLHKDFEGEWDFDLRLKPIRGFPIYPEWFQAILGAQRTLLNHSSIQAPILILHSGKSTWPKRMCPETHTSDIVLNVAHIKKWGPTLGPRVTMQEIPNAIHDIFLSSLPIRSMAFEKTTQWLTREICN